MKKREDGLPDISAAGGIDPDINRALETGRYRAIPRKERARKQKQQDKNTAAAPRRVDYLLTPEVKEWVKTVATRLGCTESQVVLFGLEYLRAAVTHGAVDLEGFTEPINNPRYKTRLNYPADSQKLPGNP